MTGPISDPGEDVLDGVVLSGSAGEIDWDDPSVRQHLAGALGMKPGEIWSNTWAWLKGLLSVLITSGEPEAADL